MAEGLVLVHFHNNCITIPLGLLIERNSLSLGLQHVQIVFSRSLSGVFFSAGLLALRLRRHDRTGTVILNAGTWSILPFAFLHLVLDRHPHRIGRSVRGRSVDSAGSNGRRRVRTQ